MTTSSAEELKQQGNKAFSSGAYEKAIELFSQAIAVEPENHVLFSNRSAAFCSMKDYTRALEDADKCINIKPDWAKGYGRKGAALHGLSKFVEAEKVYNQGLKVDPNNAMLKKGLDDVNAALDSANPMGAFGQIFSGDVLARIAGNPQISKYLAEPDYVQKIKSLQTNPQLIGQYLQDQRIMQTMGALMGINITSASGPPPSDESVPMETEAEPKPTPAPAPKEPEPESEPEPELSSEEIEAKKLKDASKAEKEKGNQFYKKRQFDEALACYDAAWESNKDDITILTNKAAVFYEQGEFSKCIQTCEEAIERGREIRADFKLIAKAYGRIGNAYAQQEDYANAIKFYEKSLTEHRTPDVLKRLREVEKLNDDKQRAAYQNPELAEEARNKGNEFFKDGKFAEAIPFYTEAIQRAESDPRGYSNRAACYTKLMALPEALRDAEKSIALDKTFVKGYIRKAAIQFGMKEYSKCMETCDEALEVDAEHHAGKHRQEIEGQKQKALFTIYGGAQHDSNESPEERLKKAMQDPKVQEILSDPFMRTLLDQMAQNPEAAREHMKNPKIRENVMYLSAAGVIGLR